MKKLMKTVVLHLEDGEMELQMNYLPLEKNFVDGAELLQSHPQGCFIERKHAFLQTQVNLTNSDPCRIIVFDMAQKFVAVKSYLDKNTAPYSMLISEPYLLLLPANSDIHNLNIVSLNTKNDNFESTSGSDGVTPKFPFIILKLLPAMYKIIPVYINESSIEKYEEGGVHINFDYENKNESHLVIFSIDEKLKAAVIELDRKRKMNFSLCIVLYHNHCIYFKKGSFNYSNKPPQGGVRVYTDDYYCINNNK